MITLNTFVAAQNRESVGDPALGGWRPLTTEMIRSLLGELPVKTTQSGTGTMATQDITSVVGYYLAFANIWRAMQTIKPKLEYDSEVTI